MAKPSRLRHSYGSQEATADRPASPVSLPLGYAALTTLFERRQRVHTRIRLTPPLMTALTRWMLGLNVRLVTLCA